VKSVLLVEEPYHASLDPSKVRRVQGHRGDLGHYSSDYTVTHAQRSNAVRS
jgi:hypothetical protein